MNTEDALDALAAAAEPGRSAEMQAYHKAERQYLGTPNPAINDLATTWRHALSLPDRVALADGLWRTDIHEARIAAAKLLTQARIRDDGPVWDLVVSWVPQFDAWAIADHACSAGARRLVADPARLDTVETWTRSDHLWSRRAALVMTLPWAKMSFPGPEDVTRRDRILGWAAGYVADRDWFIQKAVAWWVRDLSKHDADRARAFLEAHGASMKGFARKEAARYLQPAS